MTVITISAPEKQVAKTATAIHTAHAASTVGLRTLLIDFCPNHEATKCLGIDVESIAQTKLSSALLVELAGNLHQIPAAIVHENVRSDLDLLPGDASLALVLSDGYKPSSIEKRTLGVTSAVRSLASRYDVVVVDTPASPPRVLHGLLCSSDLLVVPISSQTTISYQLSEFLSPLLKRDEPVQAMCSFVETFVAPGQNERDKEFLDKLWLTIERVKFEHYALLRTSTEGLEIPLRLGLLRTTVSALSNPEYLNGKSTAFDEVKNRTRDDSEREKAKQVELNQLAIEYMQLMEELMELETSRAEESDSEFLEKCSDKQVRVV